MNSTGNLLTPLWTWSISLSEWLCILSLHIQRVGLWGRLLGALEKAECLGVVKRFSLDPGNQFRMTLMGVKLPCSPMTKGLQRTLYLLCLSLFNYVCPSYSPVSSLNVFLLHVFGILMLCWSILKGHMTQCQLILLRKTPQAKLLILFQLLFLLFLQVVEAVW